MLIGNYRQGGARRDAHSACWGRDAPWSSELNFLRCFLDEGAPGIVGQGEESLHCMNSPGGM